MHPYQRVYKLIVSLGRWLILAFIAFTLSACGTTGTSPSPTSTAELSTPAAASHAAPAVTQVTTPVVTPIVTSTMTPLSNTTAWKTYRNDRAGYTVEYPADWKINERNGSDGTDVTTFTPPDSNNDGIQLTVMAQNESSGSGEIPDMPNTRCQQVMVGKLSGTRCLDTIAFSTTTTLMGQGKVYILASSGKRFDQNIYQHFLDSFAVTA